MGCCVVTCFAVLCMCAILCWTVLCYAMCCVLCYAVPCTVCCAVVFCVLFCAVLWDLRVPKDNRVSKGSHFQGPLLLLTASCGLEGGWGAGG